MAVAHTLVNWVLGATWGGSIVALLVLAAQRLLGSRLPARWRYNLCLLAVVRLLLPVVPGVKVSPFNWLRWDRPRVVAAIVPHKIAPPAFRLAQPRMTRIVPPVPTAREPLRVSPRPPMPVKVVQSLVVSDDQPVRDETPQPVEATATSADDAAAPQAAQNAPREPRPRAAKSPPPPAPVPLPRAQVAPPRQVDWQMLIALGWCAGAAALLARIAWASLRVSLALRRLPPVNDSDLLELAGDCCRLLKIRRVPRLLESPAGSGPTLVGFLRPRLLLPACVVRHFAWREQRLILLHELVHLKRRDVAVNYLLAVVQAVHWFNPLTWVLVRKIRAERELACDEAVLASTPWRESRAYGSTIVKLLEILSRGSWPAGSLPMAVGVVQHKALVYRRIAMIARFDGKRQRFSTTGALLSLVVGGVALTGAVRTEACDPATGEVKATEAVVTADAPAPEAKADAADVTIEVQNDSPATETKPEEATAEAPADKAAENGDEPSPGKSASEDVAEAQPAAGAPPAAETPTEVTPEPPAPPEPAAAPEPPADAVPPPALDPTAPPPAFPSPQPHPYGPRPGIRNPLRTERPLRNGARVPGMGNQQPMNPALGQPGPQGPGVVGRIEGRSAAEADAQTLEKLQQNAPAEFDHTPLKEALYQLVDAAGVGLYIDDESLGNSGVQLDTPVNIHIREGVPVEQSLEWALKSAGKGMIGFAIERGVILVASNDELSRHLITRVYNLRGIDRDGREDSVPQIIMQTVEPGSWTDNGGSAGTIRTLGEKLIITASEPNQREIGRLLEMLRENPQENPEAEATTPGAANAN